MAQGAGLAPAASTAASAHSWRAEQAVRAQLGGRGKRQGNIQGGGAALRLLHSVASLQVGDEGLIGCSQVHFWVGGVACTVSIGNIIYVHNDKRGPITEGTTVRTHLPYVNSSHSNTP